MIHEETKPLYQKVYASYAVTPQSALLLQTISQQIIHLIYSSNSLVEKPEIILPKHYHMSIEPKTNPSDLSAYREMLNEKRKILLQDTLTLSDIGAWESNTTNRSVIYAKLPSSQAKRIPYAVKESFNAHVTLANIENNNFFHAWLVTHFDIFKKMRDREITQKNKKIEVDVKKIIVRGTVDGKKGVIEELEAIVN